VHDARVGVGRLHAASHAVLLVRAAPGHRQHAGGLVDDDEAVVHEHGFR
jgi:hypothetical protein